MNTDKNKTLPMDELRISIISSCNMKCVYCHNEGNRNIDILSLEDIELLIQNSLDFGLKSIRLTGGEPLLHEDIISICKMIKEKYQLKVGINTNGILVDKLLTLVENNYLDRIVIGIDYYGDKCSKASPVGDTANKILDNIKRINNGKINISLSCVYHDNYDDIVKLIEFGIANNIIIKIIEKVDDEKDLSTSVGFIDLREKLLKKFNMERAINNIFNEVEGWLNNKKRIVFFHSHCRLRECDLCKKMHLRVLSNGNLKPCLLNEETEIYFKEGNIKKNIETALTYLGQSPK